MQKQEKGEPSRLSVLQKGLQEYIYTELQEGTDYEKINGYDKPTLLKPGAEKICRYLELSIEYSAEHRYEDWDKGLFLYEVKVRLRQLENGGTAAGGIGSANTKEPAFAQPNGYPQLNTVIEMAKKRALIDAALNVSASSGHFTQDVEDLMKTPQVTKEEPITKNQLTKIYQLVQDLQIDHDVARTMIQTTFHVRHSIKLSKSQTFRFIQQQRLRDNHVVDYYNKLKKQPYNKCHKVAAVACMSKLIKTMFYLVTHDKIYEYRLAPCMVAAKFKHNPKPLEND